MSSLPRFVIALFLCACCLPMRGADEKKETPRVLMGYPLGLIKGATNVIYLRGLLLTNVHEVRSTPSREGAFYRIVQKEKAKVPEKQDAKKAGDTEVKIEAFIPLEGTNRTISLMLPETESEPGAATFQLFSREELIDEIEPNGSFLKPQSVELPVMIRGAIQEPLDVDVFAMNLERGDILRAEVTASRMGSLLDSILTIYDAEGHLMRTCDDAEGGRDSQMTWQVAETGRYYLSLIDANDLGGVTHPYLLKLQKTH